MNRITAAALYASLCLAALPALAQDKAKSEASGQEKLTPTPGKQGANNMGTTMGTGMAAGTGTNAPTGMGMGMGMKHDAKSVDTNGDGMVSKAEFMKHQETMWTSMKKNAKGQVSVADMDGVMMGK